MSERTAGLPAGERREFQRLELPQPLVGHFGGHPVQILDLGVLGARLEHATPLEIEEGTLAFDWKGQPIEFESGVVRTFELEGRHQSGVRFFRALGSSDHELHSMLSELVAHEIERRASSPPVSYDDESEPTHMDAPFVTFRLDENVWLRRPAFTPSQPENGFTIPMRGNDVELKRLCLSYSAGDEEARRLVRLFAELSISEELGVPRRG